MWANPSQPVGINYTAYDQLDTLLVAAKVYDITGAPALIATVPLLHTALGSYNGLFNPAEGHQYAVISMVYDDAMFTIPDLLRSPSTMTVECSAVATSVINPANKADVIADINNDVLVATAGVVVDLSNCDC